MFNIFFLFLTSLAAGIRVRGEKSGEMSGGDMSSIPSEQSGVPAPNEADMTSSGVQVDSGLTEPNAPSH